MAAFWSNWFPNIVCTFGGCLLSWLIGYRQGKRAGETADAQIRMLRTLLQDGEDRGLYKLRRDAQGNIVSGRIIELAAKGAARSSVSAQLTTGPAYMACSGSVTSKGVASIGSLGATTTPTP
jgi:hypothetical protein